MNISGAGGAAASLPMTLPSSGSSPATPPVAGETSTSRAGSASGDVRMPGQAPAATEEIPKPETKEVPKPEPLPPLPALTVAEIRAMLGMATLPEESDGRTGSTAAGGATQRVLAGVSASISSSSFDGYI